MSRRKKFVKKVSKFEKDAILITSRIVAIEQQNELIGENFKNVFYIESKQLPETGRMCVLWGRSSFNVGDKIQSKGRINEQGTFLAWSLMILERAKNGEV